MRIQYTVNDNEKRAIEQMMRDSNSITKRELFDKALCVFEWIVKEKQNGRSIISKSGDDYDKELIIPGISNS